MPTLAIELSDTAYSAAMQLPEEYRRRILAVTENNLVAAAKTFAATQAGSGVSDDAPPTPDDLAAIGRGIADEEAGRFEDGFSMMARLHEERRSGTGAFAEREKHG